MSKMSEVDMKVQEGIKMIQHYGMNLAEAMDYVKATYGIDSAGERDIILTELEFWTGKPKTL